MYERLISLMAKTVVNPNPFPSGLSVWGRYKASSLATANGAAATQWDDISGNNRHWTQSTSARRAIMDTAASGLTNVTKALHFTGTDADPHYYDVPDMSALTQGHIFIFLKNDNETNKDRLHNLGTATDYYYKYVGGGFDSIYDGFGSTVRKTTGNPPPGVLINWHMYDASSASGAWFNRINNVQWFTTGTNTVGFPVAGVIGGYLPGTSGIRLAEKLITEIVILDTVATAPQRAALRTYFFNEYVPYVFADDFNDNSFDTARWSRLGSVAGFSISETGQQLQQITGTTTSGQDGIVTVAGYPHTNRTWTWEAAQLPHTGAQTGHTMYMVAIDIGNAFFGFIKNYSSGDKLTFEYNFAGANDVTITYDATNHRWMRMRHDAIGDTMYWDTSPDNVTWTNQRTVGSWSSIGFDMSSMKFRLQCNCAAGAVNETLIYDNVTLKDS